MKPITPAAGTSVHQCLQNEIGKNKETQWGDLLHPNINESILRIGFININSLGFERLHYKSQSIHAFMKDYNVGIMGMAETGVNWHKVAKTATIWERTTGWFENQRVSAAFNRRDKSATRAQPGGTALIIQGRAALGVAKHGQDPRRLGRWTWSMIEGKNNLRTRILSAYVPCKPSSYGTDKVYYQHERALLEDGILTDPIDQFWIDFWEEVDAWLADGDQVILMGDWNTEIRDPKIRQQFESRDLLPAALTRHGDNGTGTCQGGKRIIDGIWSSSSIPIYRSGHAELGLLPADHSLVHADIPVSAIIGEKMAPPSKHQGRRLKCNDPRIVKRYLKVLDAYCSKHNVYGRTYQLMVTHSNPLTEEDKKEFEKLDKLRFHGMKLAEKKCRKIRAGKIAHSLPFKYAKLKLRYVKLTISRKRGCKIGARLLLRLSKQCNVDFSQYSIGALQKELNIAQKEYDEACRNSAKYRETYLEEIADAKELNGEGKKATHLRTMLQNEATRKTYKRIAFLDESVGSTATTFVNITQPDGSKRAISDKHELESVIIEENKKKYHQCENTPFLKEPLYSEFGRYGEGPAVEEVKNGTYSPPPGTDEVTQDFLSMCQQSEDVKKKGTIPLKRSVQEFRQSWNAMKEKTSSRELHFGHFKAGMKHDLVSIVHWILAEIPFRTGYSPRRWQNATDVMILKKLGIYDIDALRTIVLYEADFNHNNKWLGRSMMHSLVKNKRLAPEQYSIQGRKAVDHALNRRLMFDLVRYQKICIAMGSCDLKSNYDRIGHTASVLCSNRFAIPPEPMYSMYHTIQEARHFTRTAYGDSVVTYGGLDVGYFRKPQGVGQGNAYGPPGWGVISSTLFDMMREKGFGTKIVAPISNDTEEIIGFAFVDDTDVLASIPKQNDPDATMNRMQATINYWEKAAKVTGGAIAPNKSWYYLVHFKWVNGKWTYGDMSNVLNDSLSCLDKNEVMHELQQKGADVATEMLGVYLAPDGNNAKQLQVLTEKAKKMEACLNRGHLDRYESWVALTRVCTKSLEYPLPAMTFSEKQCKQYMAPMLRSYLPKAGFNRNFPRDILYGSKEYGGLGLHNPYLLQGIHHVADIIEHLWKRTPTGHFFKCNIESLRLELGINGPLFYKDYNHYRRALLTDSLICDTWRFSSENNIQFNEQSTEFTFIRANDRCFMDVVYTKIQPQYWAAINRCRHFLRILTVSDICSGDGKRLHPVVYNTTPRCESSHNNNICWPLWERPCQQDWTTWRREIPLAFTGIHRGHILLEPLGAWLETPTHWLWFKDKASDTLYRHENKEWFRYARNSYSARVITYSKHPEKLPSGPQCSMLIPTSVTCCADLLSLGGTASSNPPSPPETSLPTPSPSDTPFYFTKKIEFIGPLQKVLQAIKDGDATIVSDGSFDPKTKLATAAWTIYVHETLAIRGLVHVPGLANQMDSYRAELAGLLGIFEFLEHHLGLCLAPLIIHCDGKSVLDRLRYLTSDKCAMRFFHSDLLTVATRIRDRLQIEIEFNHVKGHQDSKKSFEQLSQPAQLNVQVDALAKTFRRHIERTVPEGEWHRPLCHKDTYIQIFHDGELVVGNPKPQLYTAVMKTKQIDYWVRRGKFTHEAATAIAWPSYHKSLASSRWARQHFITKWNTQQLATGLVMQRWDKRALDHCPFCPHAPEDTKHILLCQSTEVRHERTKAIEQFLVKLSSIDTSPLLRQAIEVELQHWSTGVVTAPSHYILPSLQPAILEQRSIGWQSFLEGFISSKMLAYQATYYNNKNSKKSILSWSSIMIRAGWTVIFSLWQHRNEKLHHTPIAADLEGQGVLNAAISAELQIGAHTLPHRFRHYFTFTEESIISRSLRERKNWFKTVRLAREKFGDTKLVNDEFSEIKGYYRRWVGLP